MPSYNRVSCIEHAIESVLLQDYQNKELVVVDGGSVDGTVEIIRGYAQKHPWIKWISEKDGGVYDAMNKGILMSQGEWIYFLGTDDTLYDPNVVSRVMSLVDSGCQIVYGNVVSAMYEGLYDGEFGLEKILRKNICHQAIFYRRKLFESIGLFTLRYKVMADYEFNLKWMLNPNIKHKYVNIIVANYGNEGMSSAYPMEAVFVHDFPGLILRYGKKTLPSFVLRRHMYKACSNLVDEGQLRKSLACFTENLFLLGVQSSHYVLLYFMQLLRYVATAIFVRVRGLVKLW